MLNIGTDEMPDSLLGLLFLLTILDCSVSTGRFHVYITCSLPSSLVHQAMWYFLAIETTHVKLRSSNQHFMMMSYLYLAVIRYK